LWGAQQELLGAVRTGAGHQGGRRHSRGAGGRLLLGKKGKLYLIFFYSKMVILLEKL
jgi:hypothetical protein